LRLPSPVRPGSVLSGSAEILQIDMGPRRADVRCHYEMADQNDNVVMTMVGIQVVRRRHPLVD